MEHEQRREEERETRRPAVTAPSIEHEPGPVERLASGVGNRAFSALAREGAGILPDGRAHPDVEAAIGRTRGAGSSLDTGSRQRMGSALGDPLADVRVHTDDTADSLARSVSARAFTTGADLYFARGEYQPSTSEGQRLLAHELSHVVQQRGAPTSGPLVVSQPGEALEVEADAAARELVD
jgi:Domain of unknown function (DUF4157)